MKAPDLTFSLWCMRKEIFRNLEQSLDRLLNWDIRCVEIAGFGESDHLIRCLKDREINICGVVAPPIKSSRGIEFYKRWFNEYLTKFESEYFSIQTLPYFDVVGTEENIKRSAEKIAQIAHLIDEYGCKLSYHPFTHDFQFLRSNDDLDVLHTLFKFISNSNIGLQLDTFWLYENNISIEYLNNIEIPIHSLHLSEMDEYGKNVELGSITGKRTLEFINYFSKIKNLKWILENDANRMPKSTIDVQSLKIMEDCVQNWSAIYQKAMSFKEEIHDYSSSQRKIELLSTISDEDILEDLVDDELVYNSIISDTYTEELFENEGSVKIDLGNNIINYYVGTRTKLSGLGNYDSYEELFYEYFWIDKSSNRELFVVGHAGTGKSTFIKYCLQYYVPNYLKLQVTGDFNKSPMIIQHDKEYTNHKIIYIDCRLFIGRDSILRKVSKTLFAKLESLVSGIENFDIVKPQLAEHWNFEYIESLMRSIRLLKGNWLFTLVFDNADMLLNTSIRTLFDEQKELKSVYKVVIPIRPETLRLLSGILFPVKLDNVIRLGKLNFDELMKKRRDYLDYKIMQSDIHVFIDIYSYVERRLKNWPTKALFDMRTPEESRKVLGNQTELAYEAITKLLHSNEKYTRDAKLLITKLAGNSARRNLIINRTIAFSDSFREKCGGNLSIYYFLDGLIRGSENYYVGDHKTIVNCFNLAGAEEYSFSNLCLGLHMIELLSRKYSWAKTKRTLLDLEYGDEDIKKCRQELRAKEIVRGGSKNPTIHRSLAEAHMSLISRRSYLDNMAIACAENWNEMDSVYSSDPLDASTFVNRIASTTWLISKIHDAEKNLFYDYYSGDRMRKVKSRLKLTGGLKIWSVLIASKYRKAIIDRANYDDPSESVNLNYELWSKSIAILDDIVAFPRKRLLIVRKKKF